MQDDAVEVLLDRGNVGSGATEQNSHEVIMPQYTLSDTALIAITLGTRSVSFGLP